MKDKKELDKEKFREKIAKGEVMEFTWEYDNKCLSKNHWSKSR